MNIVGHFDMKSHIEQKKSRIFSKCHKGYSLGVLVECNISAIGRYGPHIYNVNLCESNARTHIPIVAIISNSRLEINGS